MRLRSILFIAACLALAACSGIRDGVVVAKKSRIAMMDTYQDEFGFRYEPVVYWVDVRGKDARGRDRVKHIFLFRNDWMQLRAGDRWSRQKGFSPAEAGGGK
ncbi:MAG TPA: hypothetical protein VHY22_18370 [Chthoniobacteraceae bacterium]|jgi:hypothetical protein|nr:hypothetical protein [Chthoniobacteraceae bacterium]